MQRDDMSNRFSDLKNVNAEQLATRATAVLPPWLMLLLVIGLAWQLSKLTWLLLPRGETVVAPLTVAAPTGARQPAARGFDVNPIVAAHLFGEEPAEPVAPVAPPLEEIDDTELRLTLRGTIAANDDRMIMAIISDDRGEERLYAIGDTITGGRKLHSVLPDRAILDNNGKLEALRLPRDAESTATSTPARRSLRTAPTARNTPLQQQLVENPAKLTDLIRPQPVFSNGKQLGYRVYPGRKRQQFLALGLKPGDLLTEINGTPLDDPARGAEIFRTLSEATQVSVTIERNGSPQVLVLDPDQLTLESDGNR